MDRTPVCFEDVVLLLHALDELVDQLVDLAVLRHLVDLLLQRSSKSRRLREPGAGLRADFPGCVAIQFRKARVGIAEAGVQQVVGESLEQVFHVHLGGQVAVVLGVANALHRKSSSCEPERRDQSYRCGRVDTALVQAAATLASLLPVFRFDLAFSPGAALLSPARQIRALRCGSVSCGRTCLPAEIRLRTTTFSGASDSFTSSGESFSNRP